MKKKKVLKAAMKSSAVLCMTFLMTIPGFPVLAYGGGADEEYSITAVEDPDTTTGADSSVSMSYGSGATDGTGTTTGDTGTGTAGNGTTTGEKGSGTDGSGTAAGNKETGVTGSGANSSSDTADSDKEDSADSENMVVTAFDDEEDTTLTIPEDEDPDELEGELSFDTYEVGEGEPLSQETDIYTRDLLYDKDSHKQFITIQDRKGNTFYVIIDYDAPVDGAEEQYQTYFLNPVDAADMEALTKDNAPSAGFDLFKEEEEKPEEPETETEKTEEKQTNPAMGVVVVIVFLGVIAFVFFKFFKGKLPFKKKRQDDIFDEEPGFAEDDEYEDYPERLDEDEEEEDAEEPEEVEDSEEEAKTEEAAETSDSDETAADSGEARSKEPEEPIVSEPEREIEPEEDEDEFETTDDDRDFFE